MSNIKYEYASDTLPMPVLVRQIGEDKWQDGENIVNNRISQGEQGNIDIVVETHYGNTTGTAWKFVVHHDNYYQTIARQTWAKNNNDENDDWKLRYVWAPYIV